MEDYLERQWKKLDDYIDGILDGSIVSNKWIKLAVNRYLKDLKRTDLIFKRFEVEMVFKFFFLINVNYKNKYQRFEPLPYQVFIVANLFGFWIKETDSRRFRYMLLFIARKSGKTVFATIMNIYFLVADGEHDPQALLLASTREQSNIALDYAKSIILNSPALAKHINVQQYQIRFDFKKSRGFMKTLASNSVSLDGYNPSSAILDEIHAYNDDSLFRVVKSGILARKNPMIMLISTAGFKFDSFCNDIVENMKNVLLENIEDDSFFALLYTLDEDDDFNDSSTWIKSNPALGSIMTIESMEIEHKQAENMPSLMPNFLTKNLNIFTQSTEEWIEDDLLKKVFKDIDEEKLHGMDMYLGLDLSSTKDLTSLVGIIHNPDDGKYYVFTYFFRAENRSKLFRKAGIDLTKWINQDYIIQCQTKRIDYDLVFEKIAELSQKFNVVAMAYDKFNSALIIPKVEELGINCEEFAQTALKFNFPLKYLEKQVTEESIVIQTNPVLLWNFRNVVLYYDGNGNIKIMKNKSKDAVDGCVSLGMAMGMWLHHNLDSENIGLNMYNEN